MRSRWFRLNDVFAWPENPAALAECDAFQQGRCSVACDGNWGFPARIVGNIGLGAMDAAWPLAAVSELIELAAVTLFA